MPLKACTGTLESSLLSFLFVCLKLWACSPHAPLPWTSSWPETQNQWEQQSMDQNLKKKWRLKNKPFIIYHVLSWVFCYSCRKLTMMGDFFEGHKLSRISGPSYGMSRLKKLEMNFQKASQIATLFLPCIWSEWTWIMNVGSMYELPITSAVLFLYTGKESSKSVSDRS